MTKKSYLAFLSNQQGMSFPLVMVLGAVGAVVVLSMSETIVGAAGLMSDRNKIVAYESFVENIRNVMEDPAACTEMLEGIRVNTGMASTTSVDAIDSDFDEAPALASTLLTSDADNIRRGWQDPEKSFGIDRMEIEILGRDVPDRSQRPFVDSHYMQLDNPALTPSVQLAFPARFIFHPSGIKSKTLRESEMYDERFEDADAAVENAKKLMQFEDANTDSLERGRIDVRVFLNVQMTAAGQGIIRSCYGYNSAASICAGSGGTYQYKEDPQDPHPEIKCKPWKKCFQSPDGLVDSKNQCPEPFNQKGKDGEYLFADKIGVAGSGDKYLCNWCHPWPYDKNGLDESGDDLTKKTLEWLEQEWLRLAQLAQSLMPHVPDPLNPPPAYANEIYKLATEWTYLEELTKESGYAQDTSSAEYKEARALQDAVIALQNDIFAKKAEVVNLEMEVEDLEDELEAVKLAKIKMAFGGEVKQSDVDAAKAAMDTAKATYDADPTAANEIAYNDAKGDYESVKAMYEDPNIENTIKTQLATAKAQLSTAKSELAQLEADLAAAIAARDSMTTSTGQSVEDFLNPIESVKTQLVTDFGIDESVIVFMDEVRGF